MIRHNSRVAGYVGGALGYARALGYILGVVLIASTISLGGIVWAADLEGGYDRYILWGEEVQEETPSEIGNFDVFMRNGKIGFLHNEVKGITSSFTYPIKEDSDYYYTGFRNEEGGDKRTISLSYIDGGVGGFGTYVRYATDLRIGSQTVISGDSFTGESISLTGDVDSVGDIGQELVIGASFRGSLPGLSYTIGGDLIYSGKNKQNDLLFLQDDHSEAFKIGGSVEFDRITLGFDATKELSVRSEDGYIPVRVFFDNDDKQQYYKYRFNAKYNFGYGHASLSTTTVKREDISYKRKDTINREYSFNLSYEVMSRVSLFGTYTLEQEEELSRVEDERVEQIFVIGTKVDF